MESEKTFYVTLHGGRNVSRDESNGQWYVETRGISREVSVDEITRLIQESATKYKLVGGAALDMRLRRSLLATMDNKRKNGRPSPRSAP